MIVSSSFCVPFEAVYDARTTTGSATESCWRNLTPFSPLLMQTLLLSIANIPTSRSLLKQFANLGRKCCVKLI